MPVPDLLAPGLRIVFCGTALSAASERASAYYAGPGNRFWPTLHEIGLTPVQLLPEQYPQLLEHGIGLTDLCKTNFGSDREIGLGHFDLERLRAALELNRPRAIAFNGKRAAQQALGLPRVDYGPAGTELAGARVFVLPSTSGAARAFWDVAPWYRLAAWSRTAELGGDG